MDRESIRGKQVYVLVAHACIVEDSPGEFSPSAAPYCLALSPNRLVIEGARIKLVEETLRRFPGIPREVPEEAMEVVLMDALDAVDFADDRERLSALGLHDPGPLIFFDGIDGLAEGLKDV